MAMTRIVWNPLPSEEILQQIRTKAARWAADGKTDGQMLTDPLPPPTTVPYSVVREWTTVQDAQDWITYTTSLATPAEYEVIST